MSFEARLKSGILSDLGVINELLEDEYLTDLKVLSSGHIKVKRFKQKSEIVDANFDAAKRELIIRSMATYSDREIDFDGFPKIDAVLPDSGVRFHAILPPAVDSPVIVLRKPLGIEVTLEDYVDDNRMSEKHYERLCWLIMERKNILIGGSTGSGKTTFMNAIIKKMIEVSPEDSFYIIEDTRELKCPTLDKISVCVDPRYAADAVVSALRSDPDRIIFGEIREGEAAKELMTAYNTGHTGNCATLHCNDAMSSISRMENMLKTVYTGEVPDVRDGIHGCVHLINQEGFGPKINELVEF